MVSTPTPIHALARDLRALVDADDTIAMPLLCRRLDDRNLDRLADAVHEVIERQSRIAGPVQLRVSARVTNFSGVDCRFRVPRVTGISESVRV